MSAKLGFREIAEAGGAVAGEVDITFRYYCQLMAGIERALRNAAINGWNVAVAPIQDPLRFGYEIHYRLRSEPGDLWFYDVQGAIREGRIDPENLPELALS